MKPRLEDGAASLLALACVLALAIACSALIFAAGAAGRNARSADARGRDRASLERAVASWIESYSAAFDGCDSAFDEASRARAFDGATVFATDESSKVNPNCIRPMLLESSALRSLVKDDARLSELEQDRMDSGLSMDIASRYSAYFTLDAFSEYLSPYSYADLNTTDEFSLETIYASVTDDRSGASLFLERVKTRLRSTRAFSSGDLSEMLFPHYDEAFPIICVARPFNVNFTPELILRALIAYPDYGIPSPDDAVARLVSARLAGELSQDRVYALVGAARENHVYRFLGARTWFWKLEASIRGSRMRAIVAVLPPGENSAENGTAPPALRVVSLEYGP